MEYSSGHINRGMQFLKGRACRVANRRWSVALSRLWVMQVPLSSLDLSHVSILYTQGEMAAITPIYVRVLPAVA